MAKQIDFWTLLKLTQEYISQHYAAVLTDKSKLNQLKAYVDKYLRDNDYHVENLNSEKAKPKTSRSEIRHPLQSNSQAADARRQTDGSGERQKIQR